MKKRNTVPSGIKGAVRAVQCAAEILILTVLYYIFWRNGYDNTVFPAYHGMGKYVLASVYVLLLIVIFQSFEGFRFGYLKLTDAIISQCAALVIVNAITYLQLCLIANSLISPVPTLLLLAAEGAVATGCCHLFTRLHHQLFAPTNMVMIYGNRDSVVLKLKMDTRPDRYRISRLISAQEGTAAICEQLSSYDAVILSDLPAKLRNDILKYCYQNSIPAYVTPKISDIILKGGQEINLFDTPLTLVKGKGLSPSQRFFKRGTDILFSAAALLAAAPVMLAIGIAVKLEDGGPVFYRQKRMSLDGRVFEILKFRSMIVNAEQLGESLPATDRDPRITKTGHFIRAVRLDELPQLLNILKGEMSLVGPRPERVEHMQAYVNDLPEFDFRLKVKGGLTGYAQIYGKYNTSPYDKLRLDLMYIENYSLLLDMKLILKTLRVILKKESTEGFDKSEEVQSRVSRILDQLNGGTPV